MAKHHLSALEKEFFVRKYKEHPEIGFRRFCEIYNLRKSTFCEWLQKYEKYGLLGLERAGSKVREVLSPGVEQTERNLRLEVLRLRIENERLKKNYTAHRGEDGRMEYTRLKPKNSK